MRWLPVLWMALLVGAVGCDAQKAPTGQDDHPTDHKVQGGDEGHNHDGVDEKEGHDEHEGHDELKGSDNHEDHDKEGEDKGHDEEEQVVHLSAQALSRGNIQVGTVSKGALAGTLGVPAEVQLNPDRVAHISPLVDGQLLSVDVTLGDTVEPDQQLARLRSIELGQARADLSRTKSMREVAKRTLKRQEKLRTAGINSERSLVDAKLAYEQANTERDAALSRLRVFGLRGGSGPDMKLQSPIAGIIVERHATRGENVSPDDTLFIVADLARVWVIGRVYEQQVAKVAQGMSATLTLNAYPGRSWNGKVDYVGATLNEATRTLPIRVEIDNPDGLLRPGLFGSLRLASNESEGSTVLVPLTAVQTVDNRTVVFVPGKKDGEFFAHPVTLGREGSKQAEVLQGLEDGASVVVQGSFVLKSELMRSQLGHGHAH